MNTATALENPQEMAAPRTSDAAIRKQSELVEALQSSPYLRSFNPRHYPLYDVRHYRARDYLDSIGVEKIGELVQHGFSLGNICMLLDISVRVMRTWLTAQPKGFSEIEEAFKFAAHEDVAQAQAVLYDPKGYPDTARAKAIADLHLWKAERYNKDLYGTKQVKIDATVNNAVAYEFNINVNNKVATPEAQAALEGVFKHIDNSLPPPDPTVFEAPLYNIPEEMRPSLDFTGDD